MANQRTSAATWRERVGQWRDSGLSIHAYAEQCGWPRERLQYWARRVQGEAQGVQLLPVRVQRPSLVADVELRSPSGWTLRVGAGCEPAWLASLLSGLR